VRRAAASSLVLAAALVASIALAHAETPIPPAPTSWVTERASFLSAATASDLNARLDDYARRTGHQVLVYIDHTTGGVPIEDWGVRAFERWRVGRSGIDDGIVLLVFADDHRVRFEVGYGLEDRVPDALAKRIIEELIVPRIRAGDRDGAIRAGVGAVTAAIGGEAGARHGLAEQPAPAPVPLWIKIVGGAFLLIFIAFVVTHPSLAWLMLLSIGSGRGGWGGGGFGGGGGGGGFSGGGGRSGGGGASGSW
jgi:uncharacterized protein